MDKKDSKPLYVWRVAASHVIAYFAAGIFALVVMNYKDHYASPALSILMKPVDAPIVALGPTFQIIRGVFMALVLLPFRKIFLTERFGAMKLGSLMLGLSFFFTIGPTPGSFEGLIYTTLPFSYQLLGIPEAFIYAALFSAMTVHWNRTKRRIWDALAAVAVVLIVAMSVLGYLQATGVFKV